MIHWGRTVRPATRLVMTLTGFNDGDVSGPPIEFRRLRVSQRNVCLICPCFTCAAKLAMPIIDMASTPLANDPYK